MHGLLDDSIELSNSEEENLGGGLVDGGLWFELFARCAKVNIVFLRFETIQECGSRDVRGWTASVSIGTRTILPRHQPSKGSALALARRRV